MKDNTNLDEFKKFIDNNFHTERIKRYKYILILFLIITLIIFIFSFYVLSYIEEQYHLYFLFDGLYGEELRIVTTGIYSILIIPVLFFSLVKKGDFRAVTMVFMFPLLFIAVFGITFSNFFEPEFQYYKSPDESKEVVVEKIHELFSGRSFFYVRENNFFIRSLGFGFEWGDEERYVKENLTWLDNDSFQYTYKSARQDISKVIDLD